MNRKNIRMVSRGYHYFFVRPGRNSDIRRSVEKLMTIEPVREVSITEGEYGFVVKTNEIHSGEKEVLNRIRMAVNGTLKKAVCHCQYFKVNS